MSQSQGLLMAKVDVNRAFEGKEGRKYLGLGISFFGDIDT